MQQGLGYADMLNVRVRRRARLQHLGNHITSKIGLTVAGRCAAEATFDTAIAKAVDAMKRLYGSLGKRAKAARESLIMAAADMV